MLSLKRTLCIVVVVMLAVSIAFAGCSSTKEDTKAPTQSPSTEGEAKKEDAKPAEKVKLVISMLRAGHTNFPEGMDENNNPISDFIREKTGYDVQFKLYTDAEQLNMLIASGEPMDAFSFYDRAAFAEYYTQGILADITEHVKKSANIMKETPENVWKAVTMDGKIYALPETWIAPIWGFQVRTDWMEELGIQSPQNIDQLYAMFKAFKDKKGAAGITIDNNGAYGPGQQPLLFGLFDLPHEFVEKDGKVIYTNIDPRAKEALIFANKLYKDGLLDKEFAVNKPENIQTKIVGGNVGSIVSFYWTARTYQQGVKEKTGKDVFKFIDPPKTASGKEFKFSQAGPIQLLVGVTKASKHQAEAVDFFSRLLDEEIAYRVGIGEEGVQYKKAADGKIELVPEEIAKIEYKWHYFDNLFYNDKVLYLQEDAQWADTKVPQYKWVGGSETWNIYGYIQPLPEFSKTIANLRDLTNKAYVDFIVGQRSIDEFDAYVQEWMDNGGKDVLAKVNEVYYAK